MNADNELNRLKSDLVEYSHTTINHVIQVACALIAEGQTEHDIVGVKAAKIVKSIYKELAK